MTNKTIGKYGENLAENFLIKKGFKILEKNYHYSRIAEIDIIAEYKNIIHFVEVKTRTQTFFGNPLEAIDKAKLQQIYLGAQFYIKTCKKQYKKVQIDGLGIVLQKNKEPVFNFIEDIAL